MFLETLESRVLPSAVPHLLKDINATPESSSPSSLVSVNGKAFLTADDGLHGTQLWVSDGTPVDTTMLTHLDTTTQFGTPTALTNVNGTLFFSASDGQGGGAIWQSDGTATGTTIALDLGYEILGPYQVSNYAYSLTNCNGTLFFTTDEHQGPELWRSNGTWPGTSAVAPVLGTYLTNVTGTLFFADGNQLWKSNGTAAGTTMVLDTGSAPYYLTNVNGGLFFASGRELWHSDGTSAGTTAISSNVLDFRPAPNHPNPYQLAAVDNTLFFSAGQELWASNGTAAGTGTVPGTPSGQAGFYPVDLTNVSGTLFFSASDHTHGRELWLSNGAAGGTSMVSDINRGPGGSYPYDLVNVDGVIFFGADDGTHGRELWLSNGTTAGTNLVEDIRPGSDGSNPSDLTNVGGSLFFAADDGTHASQLWTSNGSASGTYPVKDINVSTPSSNPSFFSDSVGQTIFFAANDGLHGNALWSTNGTAAGTSLLHDGTPYFATNVNGTLFFVSAAPNPQLWRSDGTSAGTSLVMEFGPYGSDRYPNELTNVDGTLFFAAEDGTHGLELWKSNGISAGTEIVADINPGASGSKPSYLTNVNGTLFFAANDGVHGSELWRSNGTASGTVLVRDIDPGLSSGVSKPADSTSFSSPDFTNVNGTLFFQATDGVHGRELWRSDGTSSGTYMVRDIEPNNAGQYPGSYPGELTNVNGTLFFVAFDGTHGDTLWRSDGTEAGTLLVKDNISGSNSYPLYLTNVNGTIFFADGGNSRFARASLWRSDGTAAGTTLVGANGDYPGDLVNVNGTLFFTTGNPFQGPYQLWESNGSSAGTSAFGNVGGAYDLTNANGTLFFAGEDPVHGSEPWLLSPAPAPIVAVTSSPNPSTFRQSITFTATVTGPGSTLAPAGFVEVWDGMTDLTPGGVPLDAAGTATFSTLSLSGGAHVVTATFFGNLPGAVGDDSASPQVVAPIATTTSDVSSSPGGNTVYGEVLTFTASVGSTISDAYPTGTLTFTDGETTLGTGTLDLGVATFTYAGLATGAHTITASYSGDSNFAKSDDTNSASPLAIDVSADATTTGVASSDGGKAVVGETVTFTAFVQPAAPGTLAPTGSVVFTVDGRAGSPVLLTHAGQATASLVIAAGTVGGTHTVTAAYISNDNNFTNSDSMGSPLAETVGPDTTTTQVTSSDGGTGVVGETVTFTANVLPNAPGALTPTGSVIFTIDGVAGPSIGLNSSGQATTTLPLSLGSVASHRTVTAAFTNSDGNFSNSDSTGNPFVESVGPDSTNILVTATPVNPVTGQAVIFTATVSSAVRSSNLVPTGAVQFAVDGVNFGNPIPVDGNGRAISAGDMLSAAYSPHVVSAIFSNQDGNFLGSRGTGTEVVAKANTRITLASSASPSVFGQLVSFTATVHAVVPGAGTPTGVVTFEEGTAVLGRGTLALFAGVAQARFSTTTLGVGSDTITAVYAGDGNFNGSTSASLTQAVHKDSVGVGLIASQLPAPANSSVRLFALIRAQTPGSGTPTGSVTYEDIFRGATNVLGTVALNTFAVGSFLANSLGVGTHTITAHYGGDSNFTAAVSARYVVSILPHFPSAVLTTSARLSVTGQAVTFTLMEKAASGTPSGLVAFKDDGTVLKTTSLDSTGRATYSTAALIIGSHAIAAAYAGDGSFAANTAAVIQTVEAAFTRTTLLASANASLLFHPVTFTAQVAVQTPGRRPAVRRRFFPRRQYDPGCRDRESRRRDLHHHNTGHRGPIRSRRSTTVTPAFARAPSATLVEQINAATLLKDINSLNVSFNPYDFTVVNATTYFVANGSQLWETNGTATGTTHIAFDGSFPKYLTNVNGTLFFVASDSNHGAESG